MSKSEFSRLATEADERKPTRLPPQLDSARLTKYVAGSITIPPGAAVPDCQTCGVCCDHDPIVPTDLHESERLGVYVEITDDSETNVVVDRIVTRDFAAGHCAHLEGDLGRFVGCGVYDRRPDVCRDFEAGSDRCREYRRMYGLEPQLSAEDVARFAPAVSARRVGVISHAQCHVDSVSISMGTSAEDPGTFVSKKNVTVKVYAAVDGDLENVLELHAYNPDREIWLQSEFVGLTLDGARELIAQRSEQAAGDRGSGRGGSEIPEPGAVV